MSQSATTSPARDVRIVVLPRSWVVIGDYSQTDTTFELENASVIRHWGTTRGLGELAADGATKQTVLDPCLPVSGPMTSVMLTFRCDPAKWPLR